jgi:proteasome lid subunit RPN8/RPN11
MDLQIEPELLVEIHRLAEEGYPNEICGFLLGRKQLDRDLVTEIYPVVNQDAKAAVHYTIPAKEYMKAERLAMTKELELIGVYHSHPDHPPKPSGRDLDDAMPELSYLITAVYQGNALDTRSWRLTDNRTFEEETLDINFKNKLSKSYTSHG